MSTTLSPSGLVAPAVTDKVSDTIAALASNFQLLNDYWHPVGSIYYFTSAFNPNTGWGGTWVEDTSGRTDVASSSAHPAGSTWGSETHVLTVDEMPSHTHTVSPTGKAINVDSGGTYVTATMTDSGNSAPYASGPRGGGNAMSLAQPSMAVHKWVRTA